MLIRTSRRADAPGTATDDNLARLGAYSARMTAGDYDAVYEYFAPEFVSHATERVSPGAIGTDIGLSQTVGLGPHAPAAGKDAAGARV